MANSKGPSSIRSMMYNGKSSLLPPKSPFPSLTPNYTEYIPTSTIGQKPIAKPREANSNHQRTSSESFLIDEQPSWLDELLDEPETPVQRRGHRRSSSDSFAYLDSSLNYTAQDDYYKYKNVTQVPSWGPQDFDMYRDTRQSSFNMDLKSYGRTMNKPYLAPPRGVPSHRGKIVPNSVPLSNSQDSDKNPSSTEKQAVVESGPQDQNGPTEKKDSSQVKSSDTDTKRAKQQFAQRSRVRKLQYIAELERNVQALQAEGSEVSAEVEFLNQKNLILTMENEALKQRLENLAQEQLIKYMEHELLEKEVRRLRSLYQQQQQQQQQPQQQQMSSNHRRANSKDLLDQQFATLSLKHKE